MSGNYGGGSVNVTARNLDGTTNTNDKTANACRILIDGTQVQAAGNTSEHSSQNQSSSASVGVGFNVGAAKTGFTLNASMAQAQGQANGTSQSSTNTRLQAGNTLTFNSGGDTTLQGATVSANKVTGTVGGNLTLASLQDSSQYQDKSQSSGFSVSVPISGGAGSVSVSHSSTNINSNYQSVGEQTAIRAGDGGFDIDVKGQTTLNGAQITSTQAAIDNNKNKFTSAGGIDMQDVQNSAQYDASSYAVTVAKGSEPNKAPALSGAGFGADSGKASSTSTSGISGIAGNTAARTGDKETGLTPLFDAAKVKQEVQAQVAITSEFGKQAPKAVADYAQSKINEYKGQLQTETDPAKREQLQLEIAKWDEGGVYRVAIHTGLGGLAGGVGGALGAGSVAAGAKTLDALQESLTQKLIDAGVDKDTATLIGQGTGMLTSGAIGAAVGGTAGATTAFNTDTNNRQLHPAEAKLIQDNAKRYAQQRYATANPTAEQIKGAEIELANTAQNMVDNNMDVTVPKTAQAEAFLNQLKVEYAQATGSVNIGGTLGQAGGTQQLFYANTEQKNMPWLNQGLADPKITGLIVRTPINPPKTADTIASNRDRLTGLPLDEKGRYEVNLTLGDKNYSPKFYPCATAECVKSGGNLDMSDVGTQAYVKALDKKVMDDINTVSTVAAILTPVGVAGETMGIIGPLSSIASGAIDGDVGTASAKELLQLGASQYLSKVYGLADAVVNRITATVDLAGGWQAFIDRAKQEITK